MSTIFKRGRVWQIEYRIDGKVYRQSLKVTRQKLAERKQVKFDEEHEKVKAGLKKASIEIKEAAEAWLDRKRPVVSAGQADRYGHILRHLNRFFVDRSTEYVSDITPDMVLEYVSRRQADGAASKTIHEEVRVLKSILNWLFTENKLDVIPVRSWPTIKTTTASPETVGAYRKDEVEKILAWFVGKDAEGPIRMLAFTGARVGEVRALRVRDLDLAGKVARIPNLKTASDVSNQFRQIPLHPDLIRYLAGAIVGKKSDDLLFPILAQTCSARWLRRNLEAACRRLGIQYRRVHGFRHYWISRMLSLGAPLAKVMKLCGHTNISTTQRYLTVEDDDTGLIGQL